jgi:hypothetical protein
VDEEEKLTNHKYENTNKKQPSQYSSISDLATDQMARQLRLSSYQAQKLFCSLLHSHSRDKPGYLMGKKEKLSL